MKTNNFLNFSVPISSMMYVLSICIMVTTTAISQNNSSQLEALYTSFEEDIKHTKMDHFKTLFFNESIPLNTVIRTNDSLKVLSFPFSRWYEFLSTKTFSYETRISDSKYFIDNNIAYSIATYNEYARDSHVAIGTDLFLYIKRNNQWTLTSLNGTAKLVNDTLHKNNIPKLKKESIKKVVKELFSNKMSSTSLNSHIAEYSKIYYKKSTTYEAVTLSSFINNMTKKTSWEASFFNIKIIDKHMAIIKVKLKNLEKNIDNNEDAFAYISLISNQQNEPLITSIILSH